MVIIVNKELFVQEVEFGIQSFSNVSALRVISGMELLVCSNRIVVVEKSGIQILLNANVQIIFIGMEVYVFPV